MSYVDDHMVRQAAERLYWGVETPSSRHGTSYVCDGMHAMWWADCAVCGHVDLYRAAQLDDNEHCPTCNDLGAVAGSQMVSMPDQAAVCSAFLLGGLGAVTALRK